MVDRPIDHIYKKTKKLRLLLMGHSIVHKENKKIMKIDERQKNQIK